MCAFIESTLAQLAPQSVSLVDGLEVRGVVLGFERNWGLNPPKTLQFTNSG